MNQDPKALQELSEVTPKKKAGLFQNPVVHVVLLLILAFAGLAYFTRGEAGHESASEQTESRPRLHRLDQNLAQIEALREEEQKAKAAQQDEMVKAMLAAQQKPNYTATPNGQKIGNPLAIRNRIAEKKSEKELLKRMHSETTFFNRQGSAPEAEAMNNQSTNTTATFKGNNANAKFLNESEDVGFVKARQMAHPDFTLPAGMTIDATMEVAMNSQLPGMVKAIVSRDVYSMDASRLLIPKGSELLGQYDSGNISQTQNRLLIAWTRVRLPNGITAMLHSASVDSIGRAGLKADQIDHHYVERFGAAAFFSVLGAYTANAGVNGQDNYNSAAQYRMSLANSFERTANDAFNQNANIPPTLKNYQGKTIAVMVARDISFYDVLHQE